MWELDYKESWALKNWCFWSVVLEKTLESPLDCREIKPVHPKQTSCEYSLKGLDAEAEIPMLSPLDAKNWLIWKTLMVGKIECRRRRGWQRMRGLEGIIDSMDMSLSKLWELVIGRESWCAIVPAGHKEWDMTEQVDWTEVRLSKAFLPRSKHLLILWLQSPSAVILEPQKIKSLTVQSTLDIFAFKLY